MEKIAETRECEFATGRVFACLPQEGSDFRRGHARGNGVNGRETDEASGIEDENRRFGDAAFLPGIVNVPVLDNATSCVAQDAEGQAQFAPHGFGFFGRVDGDRGEICAARANFLIAAAVIRQLAETEGSPMASIEKEDKRATGGQLGKAPRRARGIRQLEFRRNRSHNWKLPHCCSGFPFVSGAEKKFGSLPVKF